MLTCTGTLEKHSYDAMWCTELDERVDAPNVMPDGHLHPDHYRTECGHIWTYPEPVYGSFTTHCNTCGDLLMMKDGKLVLFQRYLHEKNPTLWPATGNNTGYIELTD